MTATETDVEPESPPRWGAADLIVAFLVANIASAVALVLYASSKGIGTAEVSSDMLSMSEAALLQIPLWAGLLGVPLLAARLRGNGPVRDLGLRARWIDVPAGVGIGIACQLVLVPLVTLPILLLTDASNEDLEAPAREIADKADSGVGVVLLVLVVVVGAPLAEEVFYRGMLQRTMARRLPIWPTMVLTAILFGASHGQALQFPALVAFGVVLSYLAHRSGRLGMSIWAHVGFNATTVVILLA